MPAAFASSAAGLLLGPVRLSPLLLLLLLLLLLATDPCVASSKCYTCDNYFELNMRNLDTTSKTEVMKRYCSISTFLTDDNQADCSGIDFDGCVKIVSRSYRHHIDRVGVGMRPPETLIATVVTRDCADIPPAMGVGCHMLYGAGSTTEMCYCKGDYCNSAPPAAALAGGRAHLLLLLLLLMLQMLMMLS